MLPLDEASSSSFAGSFENSRNSQEISPRSYHTRPDHHEDTEVSPKPGCRHLQLEEMEGECFESYLSC